MVKIGKSFPFPFPVARKSATLPSPKHIAILSHRKAMRIDSEGREKVWKGVRGLNGCEIWITERCVLLERHLSVNYKWGGGVGCLNYSE